MVMAILKGKMPAWLGFILMLAASLLAILGGAAIHNFKAIPLGMAGVIGMVIASVKRRHEQSDDKPKSSGTIRSEESRATFADERGQLLRSYDWGRCSDTCAYT
jgi:hypothetical protein